MAKEIGNIKVNGQVLPIADTKARENIEKLEKDISELNKDIESCFQSVSDGKALVASAITGKGVATNQDDTFETMATNIGNISTANQGSLNTWAQDSTSPSFSVKKDKLYVFTLAVQGTTNNCSLVSGATQISKKSQYRSCSSGLYMHTFLIRTTSTKVVFSINANPAVTWYQIEK